MERDIEEEVSYQQWENLPVQRSDKKGVMKVCKRWDKVNCSKPAHELSAHFDKVFTNYLAHIYKMSISKIVSAISNKTFHRERCICTLAGVKIT